MSFGGGGWGGVQSHFRVQPNYSVEVVLYCRWGCDNCILMLGGEEQNKDSSFSGCLSLSSSRVEFEMELN